MYLLIISLPLIGGILGGLFGRKIGEEGVVFLTTALMMVAGIGSIYSLYEIGICGNKVKVEISDWIEIEGLKGGWTLMIDSLTSVMMVVVCVISSIVHIYGGEYMKGDTHRGRFMIYLSYFTFSMLILVTGDNYGQLFVGWELVGVCSYLLINYWYTRIGANKAAIQAMIINRIGDVGLILGIIGIYKEYGGIEYEVVYGNVEERNITIIVGLLWIGAVGKSAQIGLHIWLPNAMEGPTPVSALIHAATMVTAGVYLLARSSPLIEYGENGLWIITLMSGITIIVAGTIGIGQNDLKKVIAYSTASQLGYMTLACGLSAYSVGIFHVMNHAVFKALLFLSAGIIIHGMGDEQDMRKLGGLRRLMPYTYVLIVIGTGALIGIPFLTGYYSKDLILEIGYATGGIKGSYAFIVGSIGVFCTAYYSVRLIILTFIRKVGSNKRIIEEGHEGGWKMSGPLIILGIGSIFIGYILKDMIVGLGTDFWHNAIFIHPEHIRIVEAENINYKIKGIPLILTGIGILLGITGFINKEKNIFKGKMTIIGRKVYIFLNRKWLIDKVIREWIVQKGLNIGLKGTYKGIDRGILEILGPSGLTDTLYNIGYKQSKIHSGNVYHYILMIIIGGIIIWII